MNGSAFDFLNATSILIFFVPNKRPVLMSKCSRGGATCLKDRRRVLINIVRDFQSGRLHFEYCISVETRFFRVITILFDDQVGNESANVVRFLFFFFFILYFAYSHRQLPRSVILDRNADRLGRTKIIAKNQIIYLIASI